MVVVVLMYENRPINKWFISFIYASCLEWFHIFSVRSSFISNLSLSSLLPFLSFSLFLVLYSYFSFAFIFIIGVICIANASGDTNWSEKRTATKKNTMKNIRKKRKKNSPNYVKINRWKSWKITLKMIW